MVMQFLLCAVEPSRRSVRKARPHEEAMSSVLAVSPSCPAASGLSEESCQITLAPNTIWLQPHEEPLVRTSAKSSQPQDQEK